MKAKEMLELAYAACKEEYDSMIATLRAAAMEGKTHALCKKLKDGTKEMLENDGYKVERNYASYGWRVNF